MEEHVLIVQEGKIDDDVMRTFYEWLFASTHPDPPEDAEANERNYYSNYVQNYDPTMCHPCTIDPRTMLQIPSTEKKNQHRNAVNVVERHMCIDYCDKNSAKRAKKGLN